jgi:hypothetical protein
MCVLYTQETEVNNKTVSVTSKVMAVIFVIRVPNLGKNCLLCTCYRKK